MNKYIDFVNSKATREYLNDIDFVPSGFEAAYIVCRSNGITLKEKHELWNEIINTTKDEILEKEFKSGLLTFHEFLIEYMRIQNILCEQFFEKEPNVVYTCSSGVLIESCGNLIIKDPFYWCNIYTDLDLCISDAFAKKYPPCDVRKHYIKKHSNDKDYSCIWADFSENCEIINVGEVFVLNDNDSEIYHFFDSEFTCNGEYL